MGTNTRRDVHEFVAGSTAALINTSVLFPLSKLIFRQMAGGYKTQFAVVQMRDEGWRYLYRGILPPLLQKMATVSIMFGSFGHYKRWTDERFKNSPHVLNLILASWLTGATEAILTPMERVQMLLQDRNYHSDYKNTFDTLIKLRHYGYAEYYRGLTCVLVRNGPSNILFFGLRDEIKKFMPKWLTIQRQQLNTSGNNIVTSQSNEKQRLPSHISQKSRELNKKRDLLQDFLSGATLGMFISTLFYPLSVVRTRMQTRPPGTEFLSIAKAFNAVYSERDRKFTRLFHGCLINVMRQFVSWGVINCSFEWVLGELHRIG